MNLKLLRKFTQMLKKQKEQPMNLGQWKNFQRPQLQGGILLKEKFPEANQTRDELGTMEGRKKKMTKRDYMDAVTNARTAASTTVTVY